MNFDDLSPIGASIVITFLTSIGAIAMFYEKSYGMLALCAIGSVMAQAPLYFMIYYLYEKLEKKK